MSNFCGQRRDDPLIAWVFPGQGSQFVGMSDGLDEQPARATWETARSFLGWDVSSVCAHGPKELLDATEVAQIAILTASVATQHAIEATGLLPDLVAGHSVGEFAALVAARSLAFEDALQVVKIRGEAMAAAGAQHDGGMAALIGLDAADARAVCDRTHGTVVVANVNGPGQVVISGERDAVTAASEAARAAGARKVIPLAVSVAAHSPLMAEAARALHDALAAVVISPPAIPFVSSTEGRTLHEPEEIRAALVLALTRSVDWPRCVSAMHEAGARAFVEVGPGRVLSGLNKRIVSDAYIASVGNHVEAVGLANELVAESLR
jgi:[acyl-carrier-protein] S-malonyltransferase